MEQVLHRIEHGHGKCIGSQNDSRHVLEHERRDDLRVISDACAMPVEAMINKYREEFEYHITHKKCMVGVKLRDIAESVKGRQFEFAPTEFAGLAILDLWGGRRKLPCFAYGLKTFPAMRSITERFVLGKSAAA